MSTLYLQLCEMGLADQIILGVLGLFLFIQLYYYGYYYAAPLRKLKKDKERGAVKQPQVSIIVCAQNEAENLQEFLPKLLKQKYNSKFEVVVVNDGSTDESTEVLNRLTQQYNNLKVSFLPRNAKYVSRKKMCLSIGVKAASYDTLLFTDADCQPTSDRWLETMVRNLGTRTDLVLGATRFEKIDGFTGNLIDYDNLFSTMQYMGYALCGKVFRGSIRNMAYKKSLYFKAKGYSQHLDLETGEDDLFIKDANVGTNLEVELSAEAITVSKRNLTSKSYRLMKEHNNETYELYRPGIKFSLWWERITRLCFALALLVALVCFGLQGQLAGLAIAALLWLARYATQATILYKNAKWLGCKTHTLGLLFFDLYLPFYEFYLRTLGRLLHKRKNSWDD